MALKFTEIEKLLVQNKNESSLAKLMIEYLSLKQILENPKKQTWYFKCGIESEKQKFSSLDQNYKGITELFNESTIDFFIQRINKNNEEISLRKGRDPQFINRMVIGSLSGENEFFTELIRLKSKTNLLMPIDYYLNKPEEFLKILN